jgi:hypothetical protein
MAHLIPLTKIWAKRSFWEVDNCFETKKWDKRIDDVLNGILVADKGFVCAWEFGRPVRLCALTVPSLLFIYWLKGLNPFI